MSLAVACGRSCTGANWAYLYSLPFIAACLAFLVLVLSLSAMAWRRRERRRQVSRFDFDERGRAIRVPPRGDR